MRCACVGEVPDAGGRLPEPSLRAAAARGGGAVYSARARRRWLGVYSNCSPYQRITALSEARDVNASTQIDMCLLVFTSVLQKRREELLW